MIRINDSAKFENIIANIENSERVIEEIFEQTTSNVGRVNDTDLWSGIAQKEFSEKYNKLSTNYEPIKESLKTYIKFLKQTIADYKEYEEQARTDIEKNNVQLDVNS